MPADGVRVCFFSRGDGAASLLLISADEHTRTFGILLGGIVKVNKQRLLSETGSQSGRRDCLIISYNKMSLIYRDEHVGIMELTR